MNRRLFVGLISAAGVAAAQGNDDIMAAEKAWVAGITRNDQAALGKLLSDSLVYTHASGVVDSKRSYMESLKGKQKYSSVDYDNVKVNRHGDATAILTARLRVQGTTAGTPFNHLVLLTHVWVKNGGQWQLAAHQTTRLPD